MIVKKISGRDCGKEQNTIVNEEREDFIFQLSAFASLSQWHSRLRKEQVPCDFLASGIQNVEEDEKTVINLNTEKENLAITGRPESTHVGVHVRSEKEKGNLELGQYSILGAWPYKIFEKRAGRFWKNGEEKGEASSEVFLQQLGKYLRKHKRENPTKSKDWKWGNLPITAGAVAYFSYDFGRELEEIQSQHTMEGALPDARVVFYDLFLVEEHVTGDVFLCTEEKLHKWDWYVHKLEEMQQKERKQLAFQKKVGEAKALFADFYTSDKKKEQLAPFALRMVSDFQPEEYQQAILDLQAYMGAGDIYVANMTRRIRIDSPAEPLKVFQQLQKNNPSPFGAYIDLGDGQLLCASPERFMQLRDGQIKTRPIKGTRKRGATPEEDQRLRRELANSEKDKNELLMIVDLERNDLNRICKAGSVKVQELYVVETYATVFQLVAEIVGELREDLDVTDVIRCGFPGGSITGAPKIRCMEIMDALEHSARGAYTGTIGYLALDGDCDLNIIIRTALHQNGSYHIGVGGGITVESDPVFEYEETCQKAKAVVAAIWEAEK